MSESRSIAAGIVGDEDKVWALRPPVLDALLATTDHELEARGGVEPFVPLPATRSQNGTMRIQVSGVITRWPQRGIMAMLFGGGTSVEDLRHDLRQALADPAVSRIVLDVDSPGGDVDGIPELAREIFDARSRKPVVALVDTMAASAAYWLASQASEVIVTPSGQVGSIGVVALHIDQSRALDAAGITPTFIHAGRYKVEGNSYAPLGDDARGYVQSRVDAFYSMFVHDVARGRGVPVETVRSAYGEGRMALAKDALKRGMVDAIAARDRAMNAKTGEKLAATANLEELQLVAAAGVARSQDVPAFVGIEVPERAVGTQYRQIAKRTFESALLDQKIWGRHPTMRFFRPETARDQSDQTSRRISWPRPIAGLSQLDQGIIWINTELSIYHKGQCSLEHTVKHEVRHFTQPDMGREECEQDADAYAARRPW